MNAREVGLREQCSFTESNNFNKHKECVSIHDHQLTDSCNILLEPVCAVDFCCFHSFWPAR